MSGSLKPHGLQQARLPCPSLTSRLCSNSCPLSRWCHPTIPFSVTPFSSCHQSFPSIRIFCNELALIYAGQSVGTSVSVLSMNQIRSDQSLDLTLCDPMNHSMPGLPVHHQLHSNIMEQIENNINDLSKMIGSSNKMNWTRIKRIRHWIIKILWTTPPCWYYIDTCYTFSASYSPL